MAGVYCISGSNRILKNCDISSNGGNLGGVAADGASVQLYDCTLSDCIWNAVYSYPDTLVMRRCVITRTGPNGNGLYAAWAETCDIEDCLFLANTGAAILATRGKVAGCTIVGSGYYALGDGYPEDLSIERTIIAFNDLGVILCPGGAVSFRCCDAYGNQSNEMCGADLGGNFSADPLFCDAANGDYTLNAESPCLPGHNPGGVDCGLVGAFGQGCGLPPAGACCLQDGSCVVEQEQVCAQHQGTYQGDGTLCDANRCATSSVVAVPRLASRPVLYAAPNPSATAARIVYEIPKTADVTVEVFNAGGSLVRRFPEGLRAAGRHVLEWDGRDGRGIPLPSGAYLARILTGEGIATTRFVLTR